MSANENLSQLFEYELELLSEDGEIKHESLLAKNITVTLENDDGSKRYFNGYISRFAYAETADRYYLYRATLRPWLWFLSLTADCRIFQNKKIPDIIQQVFRDNGFSDFELSLSGTYREWEYCVQYRETDLSFVTRLMEQEGIYYYFKHNKDKHLLVLADSVSAHKNVGDILYFPPDQHDRRKEEHIESWHLTSEVRPGKYVTDDFDFEKPKAELEARSANPAGHPLADKEIYDYPGEYIETSNGNNYARIRLEELQASYETAVASGDSRKISAGALFKLSDYPREDQNREYLVTSANYQVNSDEYVSSSASTEKTKTFTCEFSAMARTRPYRPPQVTPKPTVQGPQTAVVTGPSSEEIHTDKHGRVKVQFHWDRLGKRDENSSCWIRVAQPWAGKQWGGVFLPRIGHEVIVDFLEGDPDCPIITGSVYNAETKPPYSLPTNKTQAGLKSRSSMDGNADNFNELRFEDKVGEEEVYFHAEKDFNRIVENDDSLKVGFEKKDPGDQTVEIYNNRTTTIKQGNDSLTVSSGDRSVKVNAGKITEEAAKSIELKVGGSSIKIEPAKITIKAPQITIQADGTLTLQGGMIKIN